MPEISATPVDMKESVDVKEQAGLKTADGKEHIISQIKGDPEFDKEMLEYLMQMNESQDPEELMRQMIHLNPEIETQEEIDSLLHDLSRLEDPERPGERKDAPPKGEGKTPSPQPRSSAPSKSSSENQQTRFSSLFEMAGKAKAESRNDVSRPAPKTPLPSTEKARESSSPTHIGKSFQLPQEERMINTPLTKLEREDEEKEEKEGREHHQHQQEQDDDPQKKKKRYLSNEIQGAKKRSQSRLSYQAHTPPKARQSLEGMESIFIRFMALMERILGQAEADAHELYKRIKARTDQVDTLTLLISKINNEPGDIDWSENEEMKALCNQAKEIGVDLPDDKYSWKREEFMLLKENIQMRKDNLEKITQLERTDMQRYLQESSQCHQARSNILKMLKECGDTIIHNMRP